MSTEKISEIQRKIKIKFNNINLLKQSLIHKSFNSEKNNEKLEFLGDRVLGLVLSKTLLKIYHNESEGSIDKKFANLVNKKTCIDIAKKLNIKKFLYLGSSHKNLERSADKIESDCLEAIVGAIYEDSGLKSAENFILNFWEPYIDKSIVTIIDSKTKLQEFSLKRFKVLPKYTFSKKTGPQHNPLFKTIVEIPESKKISGIGSSKKQAQQDAAAKLIKILKL